jgi:Sulfotransferase family
MTGVPGVDTPMKIIYIGGYSRSGSTLLMRLLAESPGLVAVGELFDLWQRSYRDNQLCGCGLGFRECPFWRAVTVEAFGAEPAQIPWASYEARRHRVQGHAAIPALWVPALRSDRFARDLASYAGDLSHLFRGISSVSGARVVLESSKIPQFAWILAEMENVQLHLVHLVRDSRAAAFSWTRHKVRPEISWKVQTMDRHSVVRSGLEWDLFNVMLDSRRKILASYTLVRYEDLVEDPSRELRRIEGAVGEPIAHENLMREDGVSLGTTHTVSGNPSRFTVGPTKIRSDDEWIDTMAPRDRRLVTALTLVGLRKYGYPVSVMPDASRGHVPAS